MPARKAFSRKIRDISPTFLKRHHAIITDDGNSSEAINPFRACYIDEDERWRTANANSNHVDGMSSMNTQQLVNTYNRYIISGPARAYSQSTIEPRLPVKTSEDGRLVNGVIRLSGQRAMITAAAGLSGDLTVAAGDEALDTISDSTSDTDIRVYVFGKELTTDLSKISYADLDGTTQATFRDIDSTAAIVYTEIYGAIMVTASTDTIGEINGTLTTAVGTVIIENVTTGTDLVTFTAATDNSKGVQTVAAANRENPRGRHILVDFSALSAGDDVMLIGYSAYGVLQHEIITQAANYGLRRESANRYQSLLYVATAGTTSPRTVAVTGYDSNVFKEGLVNHVDVGSNYTESNCTQAAGVVSIKSDEATDDAVITIVGVNSSTVVTEAITLNGLSDSAGSSDFTTVYGAYVSTASTGTPGTVTVEQTNATTKMFDFDTGSYISIGLLAVRDAADAATTGTAEAWSNYDYCGANARPTLTSSNTSSTDSIVVIGEDQDGTAVTEISTLVAGVDELANEYSRITYLAAIHKAATEYVKISVEQEDDDAMFCGKAMTSADAQGTEIQIRFRPAINKARGITDRSIIQEIVGTTGVTRLDTHATATRNIWWPDASGTPFVTGASSGGTIITVGATGCDYTTLALALAAASAGDWLWLMDNSYSVTGTIDINKKLRITGMAGGATTTYPDNKVLFTSSVGNATGPTMTITGVGVILENLEIANTANAAAADCALTVTSVGVELINCHINAGTRSALIATANGADIIRANDTYFTGTVAVGSHASGEAHFMNCEFTAGITQATTGYTSYFRDCILNSTLAVNIGTAYVYDSIITGAVSNATGGGTLFIEGSRLASTLTINQATSNLYLTDSNVAGLVTVTDAAIIEIRDSRMDYAGGNDSLIITDIQTSCNIYDSVLLDRLTHTLGTVSFMGGQLEEIDQNGGTLNLRQVDVSGAFDSGGAAANSYGCFFGSTVACSAGTLTDRGSHFEGAVTDSGGAVVTSGSTLTAGAATAMPTGDRVFNRPGTVHTVGTGGDWATLQAIDSLLTANDTIYLLDDTYSAAGAITIAVNGARIISMAGGSSITRSDSGAVLVITGASGTFELQDLTLIGQDGAATDYALQLNDAGGTINLVNCVLGQATDNAATELQVTGNTNALTVSLEHTTVYGDNSTNSINWTSNNATSTLSIHDSLLSGDVILNASNLVATIYDSGFTATGSTQEFLVTAADQITATNTRWYGEMEITDINTSMNLRACQIDGVLDINEALLVNFYDVDVLGAVQITDVARTVFNAFNSYFASTITMVDATRTDVTLYSCHVVGAVGYTQVTDMNFNANDTYFDSAVTETSGTFIHKGCIFEGGTVAITTGSTASKILNIPATIRTVGVGCDYAANRAGLAQALTDSTAGDVIELYGSVLDCNSTLSITPAVTIIGKTDDAEISGAVAAGNGMIRVTATGAKFYNIRFDNTNNGAGDIAVQVDDNVATEWHDCSFDGGTDNAGIAFNLDDATGVNHYFRSCIFEDGLFDVDVHANTNIYVHDCLFQDTNATGDSGAAGEIWFFTCRFDSTFTNGAASVYQYGGDPANINPDAEYFPKTGNILTVGTGMDYTTLAAAETAASAGDTFLLMNSSYDEQITWNSNACTLIGMADDTTISNASSPAFTLGIDDCEFHNITFANSDNGAGDIALQVGAFTGKFYNCEFDGGNSGTGIAIDTALGAADVLEFWNCRVNDGLIDCDDNAAAQIYFHNLAVGDNGDGVLLDGGIYYINDSDIASPLTTGATTDTVDVFISDTLVTGAVTVTGADVFKARGFEFASTFTNTASDLTELNDGLITGAVSVVASTYIDFSNVRFGNNFTQSGAVTEGYIRDSDITGTFVMGSAAASLELHNVRVTSTTTINHANADLEVYNSRLIGNVTFTDADNVLITDTHVAGTTDIDAGTLYHFHDVEFTGAVVQDGGASIIYARDCIFTAVYTNNHANADLYAEGCRFVQGITDAAGTYGIVELSNCILAATTTAALITAVGTSFTVYGSTFTNLINMDGGTVNIYNSIIEEIDHDGGTLTIVKGTVVGTVDDIASDTGGTVNLIDTYVQGNITVGAGAAGSTVNITKSFIDGTLTRTAGTVNAYGSRADADSGTIGGDYEVYNAAYVESIEGGNSSEVQVGLCSIANAAAADLEPTITPPFALYSYKNIATGLQATEGDLAGGAGTPGYIRFDAANEDIFISFSLPENFIDTTTAADCVLEVYLDPTNANDEFDWGLYEYDNAGGLAELDAETQMVFSGAAAAWYKLDSSADAGIGDLALNKGRSYVLYMGNFQLNGAGGATTVDLLAVRLTYKVGKENSAT
jgi:hypothetical protein